jgi:plastocyanin
MKIAKHFTVVLVVLLFGIYCVDGGAEVQKEGKIVPEMNIKAHKIIRANAISGIKPAELNVERGTTVIWINESKSIVEIQFEGKQVTMSCKSPVHFIINDKGSFISDRIPMGSVASLCFVEKGEFNYVMRKVLRFSPTLEPRPYITEFKGKIIVK